MTDIGRCVGRADAIGFASEAAAPELAGGGLMAVQRQSREERLQLGYVLRTINEPARDLGFFGCAAAPKSLRAPSIWSKTLPRSLYRFVWYVSGRHQIVLVVLSIAVMALEVAPVEVQRRIINDTLQGGDYRPILLLVAAYLAVTMVSGLTKLVLNVYKGWVGENAVRWLRSAVFAAGGAAPPPVPPAATEGIQLSILLNEAEPVGGYVGESVSAPVSQIGVLVSLTAYLLYIQPLMAVVVILVFLPQTGFVPILQAAINRRIGERVRLYRGISWGVIAASGTFDNDGSQKTKISAIFATNMSIYRLKFAMNFLMNAMTHVGVAAILAMGGYFVVSGETEIGTVVAFLSALSKINDPWDDLVIWYRDFRACQTKYGLIRDAGEVGAITMTGDQLLV